LRTSSKEFNLKDFNKMIHLTNDAVQIKGSEYGKYESGNKVNKNNNICLRFLFQTFRNTFYSKKNNIYIILKKKYIHK